MSYEREEFSKRMQVVCDFLALPKEKRQTLLAKKYGKTVTTGRNWLMGSKIPSYEDAVKICTDANVTYEWLMRGSGPMRPQEFNQGMYVTDPDLIKILKVAEPLPEYGRKMAIKEVDSVRQLIEQTQAEYSKK